MGPRLWSDLRNSHTPPSPLPTPNSPSSSPPSSAPHSLSSTQSDHSDLLHNSSSPTHSVLYVCERVNSNAGGAMAAARERSSSRYATTRSGQRDLTHGFPVQVSLPDGEIPHHQYNPSLRHNGGPEQEAELLRGYIKPPENKSLSDMEGMSPNRSCSMGVLGGKEEWGMTRAFTTSSGHSQRSCSTTSTPHPQHRHSAPLEAHHHTCNPQYQAKVNTAAGSSSFSYSSSSSSMSSCSATGGSPRGRKASFQMQFFPPFLSPARERTSHEGAGRRQSRPGGTRMACTPHPLFITPSTTTALADIAVVPCGAAHTTPSFSSDLGDDEHMPLSQGIYGHLPTELATPALEDDPPPIYSEVIENPSLYRNVSRPKRRTNSGKI